MIPLFPRRSSLPSTHLNRTPSAPPPYLNRRMIGGEWDVHHPGITYIISSPAAESGGKIVGIVCIRIVFVPTSEAKLRNGTCAYDAILSSRSGRTKDRASSTESA